MYTSPLRHPLFGAYQRIIARHDRCINDCPSPHDYEKCTPRRGAARQNRLRAKAAKKAHSDCVEDCDHKLADCLRSVGYHHPEA